jgi:hypothetical protein
MGFFDDLPIPTGPRYRPHQWPYPWGPPEAEFPGIVPINTLQFERSKQAAIAIIGIAAYTAGFEIFVTHRIRPGAHGIARGDPTPDVPDALPAALRSFHLGLQFADGVKAISGRLDLGPGPEAKSRSGLPGPHHVWPAADCPWVRAGVHRWRWRSLLTWLLGCSCASSRVAMPAVSSGSDRRLPYRRGAGPPRLAESKSPVRSAAPRPARCGYAFAPLTGTSSGCPRPAEIRLILR